MSGSFSVGALAVKSVEGNAIGAVRLTMLRDRLEIELLKVGAFHESFVPGALTEAVRFDAPYTAVRGLVRRDEALVLSLDPRSPTPYTRFVLTHFTDLPLEALALAHKQRGRALLARTIAPLPIALLAALAVPSDLASGLLGRGAVGLLAGLVALVVTHGWVRVRSWGGPISERLRDATERHIAAKLAIEPRIDQLARGVVVKTGEAPERVVAAPVSAALPIAVEAPRVPAVEAQAGPPPGWAEAEAHVRRRSRRAMPAPNATGSTSTKASRAPETSSDHPPSAASEALVAQSPSPLGRLSAARDRVVAWGLAAAAVAFVLASLAVYRAIDRAPAPIASTTSAIEPPPTAAASASEAPAPPPAPCSCARADSPLWAEPIPALTILLVPNQKGEDGKPASVIAPVMRKKKGTGKYDFDLAIVNNAAVPLRDIRVVVTFARRDKKGKRVNATDRGFFWSGELAPGRSVKWNVTGPGTEYRIDLEEKRVLGDGPGALAPAPADAFVKLLGARQSSVRLHAAMMLAYLHDPRARSALDQMGELSDSDEELRRMIERASSPLFVCDSKVASGTLTSCLANDGESPADGLAVVEVGPGGRRFPIVDPIPPHAGIVEHVEGFGLPAEELTLETR